MAPSYPNQDKMGDPLLRAIATRGGSLWFSIQGEELEEELANVFNLSHEARWFTSPEINAKGNRKWRSHIQYARLKLVVSGDLNNSVRDLWMITEQGRRRVRNSVPS